MGAVQTTSPANVKVSTFPSAGPVKTVAGSGGSVVVGGGVVVVGVGGGSAVSTGGGSAASTGGGSVVVVTSGGGAAASSAVVGVVLGVVVWDSVAVSDELGVAVSGVVVSDEEGGTDDGAASGAAAVRASALAAVADGAVPRPHCTDTRSTSKDKGRRLSPSRLILPVSFSLAKPLAPPEDCVLSKTMSRYPTPA
ncbi:hypothetical protein D8W71_26345 [Rhodococcus sp. P1Y]|nr:hypothetical protein D8W71_26345 [Rhodococcus sp. P1Y]